MRPWTSRFVMNPRETRVRAVYVPPSHHRRRVSYSVRLAYLHQKTSSRKLGICEGTILENVTETAVFNDFTEMWRTIFEGNDNSR